MDRFDRLHICGFSVKYSRQHVSNLCVGWCRVLLEERQSAEHHCARRITGLKCAGCNERSLNGVKLSFSIQSFNGGDGVTIGLYRKDDIAADKFAIEQYSTRSGFTAIRPVVHAEHSLRAQKGPQCLMNFAGARDLSAVEGERNRFHDRSPKTRSPNVTAR